MDGNRLVTGRAANVSNGGATIEALRNMSMDASSLSNINANFAMTMGAPGAQNIVEYEGKGSTVRYEAGTPDVYTYNDESLHLHTPNGSYEEWNNYNFTRTVRQSEIVSSDPGRIVSGGTMSINANTVLNDNSHILAGGALNVNAFQVNNVSAQGERITSEQGTATANWRVHHKGTDSSGSSTTGYNPPDKIESISMGGARLEGSAAGQTTQVNVPGRVAGTSVNGSPGTAGKAAPGALQTTTAKVGIDVDTVNAAAGADAGSAVGVNGLNGSDRTSGAGKNGQAGTATGGERRRTASWPRQVRRARRRCNRMAAASMVST